MKLFLSLMIQTLMIGALVSCNGSGGDSSGGSGDTTTATTFSNFNEDQVPNLKSHFLALFQTPP